MEKKSSLFIIVIYSLPYKLCNTKNTRTHIESQTHIWASVCILHCWYSTIECGKVMLNGRRRSQQLCAQFCVQSKTKLLRLRWFCFSVIGIVYAEKYFKTVFLLLLLSDALLHSYNSYFFVLFTTTTVRRYANHARSVFFNFHWWFCMCVFDVIRVICTYISILDRSLASFWFFWRNLAPVLAADSQKM